MKYTVFMRSMKYLCIFLSNWKLEQHLDVSNKNNNADIKLL